MIEFKVINDHLACAHTFMIEIHNVGFVFAHAKSTFFFIFFIILMKAEEKEELG